ncbi:MAG TPA: TIM barrel protein [Bacteroidales bacterium]|nr:TIM barrel protein [Bacteroidales bacterium]HQB21372.1 TIM barrel protein [Bacteroidales bacterium]
MFKFGVAGYPLAFSKSKYNKDRLKIFNWLKDLNLDAFEAQMTYGPRTSVDNCKQIKLISEEFNIKVSVHAAYYIVLTSNERSKIERSIDTLLKTYELADLMGADVIVLHPGPLYKQNPELIMERFLENLSKFFSKLGNSNIGLFLETAGKKGQLGSVEEIIYACKHFENCFPCIDFGHVHAREGGSLGEENSIDELFRFMNKNNLFMQSSRIHFHYTPIDYGPNGEIVHKAIDDKYPDDNQLSLNLFDDKKNDSYYHPRLEPIVKNFIKYNLNATVISETHNSQEIGAMAMKAHYNILREL